MSGHFPDIHIFYRNGAAVYIIKPHQQVDHRRFAASGGSDNRHALAWLYLQIEILNELLLRRIGKRNVLQLHFPIHMLQRNRIFHFRHLRFFFDQLEHPSRTGDRVLQFCYDAGNFIKGFGVLICIAQKTAQLSDRQPSVDRSQRAEDANAGIHKAIDKTGGRICDRGKENRFQRARLETAVDFVEFFDGILFLPECLHNLLVADHFIDQSGLLASRFGLGLEHAEGPFCDKRGHKQGNRCYHQHDNRDADVDRKHEADRSQNRNHTGKELRKAHQQTVRKLIDVRDDTTDDLTVGMSVNVFEGQNLYLFKRLVSNIPHDLIGQFIVADVHNPLCQCGDPDHDRHFDQNCNQSVKIDITFSNDAVHRFTD